ncbi:hypothetical protein [Candidatus Magnetominusculus xianensis]|uniref:Uncharacterized protein n=1 Tax=Candidatus Magnetominusculus xianensis TaxID=1748249 RepID=A0ABR5SD09_9BACT|nr:hypothetical protein [Candidatus Magnetominusculus xianensis]KWT77346.1 hypothetical protein ASN18_3041 [Candidatus Magnetominusculus xianensis]MBF0404971.1 hypothetical protein [Nitrospirota bacterium]
MDSGIEAAFHAGGALSDTKKIDIQNTISEGLVSALHSRLRIVDSGIEASLFIGNALSSVFDVYTGSSISEGYYRAHHVRSDISDPVNMAMVIRNSLEQAMTVANHLRNSLTSSSGVKRTSTTWDIRVDGLSVKAAARSITVMRSDSEAISHIEIELAGLRYFDQCSPTINPGNERIALTINEVTYRFLLETRDMSEKFQSEGMTLWGRQMSGLLAEGHAEKLSQTYENAYASETAQAIAGDIAVSWDCEDYWIGELSADDYPIDAIIKLAEVSEGIVETTVDGMLRVRRKYPVSPEELKTAVTDRSFDRDNIISLDINGEAAQYSSVTVNIKGDTLGASDDFSIEADGSCAVPGAVNTVKVYIPNENIVYKLLATPEASCIKAGTKTETITETIVLTGGTGALSKSLFKLIKYELYSCDANTLIEYSLGSKEVTAKDDTCSVLEIEYETKYDEWSVSCAEEREVALCVVTNDGDKSATAVTVIMGKGAKAAEAINNDLITTDNLQAGDRVLLGKSGTSYTILQKTGQSSSTVIKRG